MDFGFPFLIVVPILLAIPALYLLIRRRARGGDGTNPRPDAEERRELTGKEQWKRRH